MIDGAKVHLRQKNYQLFMKVVPGIHLVLFVTFAVI
jgi:hypothetical protein